MRSILLALVLVYSQNLGAAPGGPRKVDAGLIRNGSATLTVPSSTDTLVGRATTDTLSNKSFSDAVTMDQLGSTPSTPASGKRKLYPKSDGFYQVDSTGTERKVGSAGGGGGENIVPLDSNWESNQQDNSDLEATLGTWAAFADSAVAVPVGDATGGSPNTTCTRTTTKPNEVQDGVGSLKMTISSGATRQGEGCSNLVYVPEGYRRSMLYLEFKYLTSGTVSDGDIVPYVYDVTNGAAISNQVVQNGIASGGKGVLRFMPNTTTAQARVAFYIARASNTGAVNLFVDGVSVSTKSAPVGLAGSDTTSVTITPSAAGFGSVSSAFFTRQRVGDTAIFSGRFVAGTTAASTAFVTLPNSVDYTKISNAASGIVVGYWKRVRVPSSGTDPTNALFLDGTSTTDVFFSDSTSGSGALTKVNPAGLISSTDIVEINLFPIPIAGWVSGVTTVSDPAALPTVLQVRGDPPSAANQAPIIFPTALKAQGISYNATTGEATVQVAGDYEVSGWFDVASGNPPFIAVYIGGVINTYVGAVATSAAALSGTIPLAVGNIVTIRPVGSAMDLGSASTFNLTRSTGSTSLQLDETYVTTKAAKTALYSAHITGTTCAITQETGGDWISGNGSHTTTGQCVLTFVTSTFSATPNCVVSMNEASAAAISAWIYATSSTAVDVRTGQESVSYTDRDTSIICMGLKP